MIEYQIGNANHSNDVDMPTFEEVDFHQIKEKSGLTMLHLNINGLLPKLDYVRLLTASLQSFAQCSFDIPPYSAISVSPKIDVALYW